jgi:hypothetical protein
MARILLDGTEINVGESLEEVLARLVNSKDGMRAGNGQITAPPGWITLTELGTGEELFVQAVRLGYVRED